MGIKLELVHFNKAKQEKVKRFNRRKAIRKRCLDCSAGSYNEVTNCDFSNCPLYPFRSGKGKQDAKARSKAIRAHCLWCSVDQPGEVWKCHLYDCTLWPYRKTRMEKTAKLESLSKTGYIEVLSEVKN